jgi:hypothetical protein
MLMRARSPLMLRLMRLAAEMPADHPQFVRDVIERRCKPHGYYPVRCCWLCVLRAAGWLLCRVARRRCASRCSRLPPRCQAQRSAPCLAARTPLQVLEAEYGFSDVYNMCLLRLALKVNNSAAEAAAHGLGPEGRLFDVPISWFDSACDVHRFWGGGAGCGTRNAGRSLERPACAP